MTSKKIYVATAHVNKDNDNRLLLFWQEASSEAEVEGKLRGALAEQLPGYYINDITVRETPNWVIQYYANPPDQVVPNRELNRSS